MRRSLVLLAALGLAAAPLAPGALAQGGRSAATTHVIKLSGFTFGGKKGYKLTVKTGDSLRFVWASGSHNVLYSKAPTGFKRVSAPKVTASRPPLILKLAKRGVYGFYCAPHRALGMTATVTVK
jgi:plastocyanin